METMPHVFKVVFVGDASVGKTSIFMRKMNGDFSTSTPTIGVSNNKIDISYNNKSVQMNIWDTAGQEQYQSLAPLYLKGAEVAIIVASLHDSMSIEHISKWHQEVLSSAGDIPCIAVVNKTDILETPPTPIPVVQSTLQAKFQSIFFVSAKTGDGIEVLFAEVAKYCAESFNVLSTSNQLNQKKGSSCC